MHSFTANSTEHPAVFARISLGDFGDPAKDHRIGVELRFDSDMRFRWYEEESGNDTEVSSPLYDTAMNFTQSWSDGHPWYSSLEWEFLGDCDPGPYRAPLNQVA